ncbi:hypothetical protein D3C79_760390 [compost metagenome]
MQHHWPITDQVQVIAKARIAGAHAQVIDAIVAQQRPVVDPGPERLRFNARLADTAARQRLAGLMPAWACQCGVPQPQVRAAPVSRFRAGAQGRAEQGPLHAPVTPLAVLEVGGDVPPLNAKTLMGTVVKGKHQHSIARHLFKSRSILPQSGKAFRRRHRLITPAQQQDQHQYTGFRLHRQIASTVRLADAAPIATAARHWRTGW